MVRSHSRRTHFILTPLLALALSPLACKSGGGAEQDTKDAKGAAEVEAEPPPPPSCDQPALAALAKQLDETKGDARVAMVANEDKQQALHTLLHDEAVTRALEEWFADGGGDVEAFLAKHDALAAEVGDAARFLPMDVSQPEAWERAIAAAGTSGPIVRWISAGGSSTWPARLSGSNTIRTGRRSSRF